MLLHDRRYPISGFPTLGFPIRGQDSGFNPLQDSDLDFWFDHSSRTAGKLWLNTAGTLPATTDGAAVARVNDRSANAYTVTQATSGNRPALKLNVQNGLSMLEGDGVNDYLDHAGAVLSGSAMTIYAVVQVLRTSFPGPSDSLDTIFACGDSGNVAYGGCTYNWYGSPDTNRWSVDTPNAANGSVNGAAQSLPYDLPASVACYILAASFNTAPTSNTGLRMFMYRNGILPGWVRLGELIGVNRTDNVAAQQRYVTYLNSIWRIF